MNNINQKNLYCSQDKHTVEDVSCKKISSTILVAQTLNNDDRVIIRIIIDVNVLNKFRGLESFYFYSVPFSLSF